MKEAEDPEMSVEIPERMSKDMATWNADTILSPLSKHTTEKLS